MLFDNKKHRLIIDLRIIKKMLPIPKTTESGFLIDFHSLYDKEDPSHGICRVGNLSQEAEEFIVIGIKTTPHLKIE